MTRCDPKRNSGRRRTRGAAPVATPTTVPFDPTALLTPASEALDDDRLATWALCWAARQKRPVVDRSLVAQAVDAELSPPSSS